MTSTAQLSQNFTQVVIPSRAVSFFRALPRWPTADDQFQFSLDYLNPVALSAIIPLFVAAALTILFCVHITVRYTCRERVVDTRIQRAHAVRKHTAIQITFAAVLTFLITVFIAVALVSIPALNESAADALDIINALIVDVSRAGFAVVDVAALARERLLSFDPAEASSPVLSDQLGEFVQPALTAVRGYVGGVYPDLGPLSVALEDLVLAIDDVLRVVRHAVDVVSAVLVVIILLLLAAPLLLFFVGAMPVSRRWRGWRIAAHVMFLFVPALLAWVLVGVSGGVGIVVADVCVAVHEYRDVLLGQVSAEQVADNALVKSNLTCPDGIDSGMLQEKFTATVSSVLQSELAERAVQLALNTSATSVADAATWTRDEVSKYVDCSALQQFSGEMEFVVCAREGHCALESIFDLWACFLALWLALTVALFSSLLGVRVAWSLLVWPRDVVGTEMGSGEMKMSEEESDLSKVALEAKGKGVDMD